MLLLVFLAPIRLIASPAPQAKRDGPTGWLLMALGLGVGAASACAPILRWVPSPRSLNTLPDTSFHISAARLLPELQSGSLLDAGQVLWTTPYIYPGGFQVLAATIVGWSGLDPISASHVTMLVCMGLVFPTSIMFLTHVLTGSATSTAVAGSACGSFMIFPFWIANAGPAWSNLLSTALVPLLLGLLVILTPTEPAPWRRTTIDSLLFGAALCSVVGAQPNGVFGTGLLGLPLLWLRIGGMRIPSRTRRRALGALAGVTIVTIIAVMAVPWGLSFDMTPPPSMGLRTTVLSVAKLGGVPLPFQTGVLVCQVAALIGWRRRETWWPVMGLAMVTTLLVGVALFPVELVRRISWPWWHSTDRILAIAVIPAVVLAGIGGGELIAIARNRGRSWTLVATVVVLGLTLSPSIFSAHVKMFLLRDWYWPTNPAAYSITPDEFEQLRTLGERVPQSSAVAINPWAGGEFLYPASGRLALFPQANAVIRNSQADTIGTRLDELTTDPVVCRATHDLGVEYVITGGRLERMPPREASLYSGLTRVDRIPGAVLEAEAGTFRLWRLPTC